jgi:hypothetical protein
MSTETFYWDEVRKQIADVRAWLGEVDSKLDRFEATRKAAVATTSTVDEDVAAAESATGVQKALERELGVDRRTIRAYAERVVKAHGVAEKLPDWAISMRFWRYLAARQPDGRVRLQVALDELKAAA